MTPDELCTALRAALDETERLAKAVKPLGYTDVMGGERVPETFLIARLRAAGEDGYPQRHADPAAKAHFAHHDPASVLRRVAADRRVLDRHQNDGSDFCVYCTDNWAVVWPCVEIVDLADRYGITTEETT
jgi:hypothetical protein